MDKSIVHDVRHLMFNGSLCLDLACDGRIDKGLMVEIREEFKGLRRTLTRLLNQECDSKLIEVDVLVNDCINAVQPFARQRLIKIDIMTMGDLIIYGNESQIGSVVFNILHNAIKYSHPSGQITVLTGITADAPQPTVAIGVLDTGRGIAKEHQSLIFEEFQRIENGEVDGYGIGLAKVKEIVTNHGGEIRVDSQLGHGSLFTVMLPIATGDTH